MELPPARMIAGHAEVRLADESLITIRPIASGDKSLIAAAFAELSEESRYRRFFPRCASSTPDSSPT